MQEKARLADDRARRGSPPTRRRRTASSRASRRWRRTSVVAEIADGPRASTAWTAAEPPVAVASRERQGAARAQLGDKTPDGSAVYARDAGAGRASSRSPSYVEGVARQEAVRPPRSRPCSTSSATPCASLEVTGPEGALRARAHAKGRVGLHAGRWPTRAGRWSVDALLGTLEGLRMESVAAERATPRTSSALRPRQAAGRTVTLGLGDGSRARRWSSARPARRRSKLPRARGADTPPGGGDPRRARRTTWPRA